MAWFKRLPTFLIVVLMAACIAAGIMIGIAWAAQSYNVAPGSNTKIDEWGTCKKINPPAGPNVFVPTNTAAEWSAFRAAPPAGTTQSACTLCPGNGCEAGESTCNCPQDCGQSCGDTCCNGTETTCNCVADCGQSCGDTCCNGSETCYNGSTGCLADCGGCSCNLPWGGTIASGASVTAYLAASPACGTGCTSQLRTCTNGTLSGSYTSQTCSACCNIPWGGTTAQGGSITAYLSAAPACGTGCSSESRTCQSTGLFNGTYTNSSCTSCCNLPWGGTINGGQSVTAYSSSAPACGVACSSQSRTCTNGSLSGTYTNSGCTSSCCLPWGGSINDGNSTTAWLVSSVTPCGSCTSQSRTCSGTTLSGSYTNASCSVSGQSCSDGCCSGSETNGNCCDDCGGCCIDEGCGLCNGPPGPCGCFTSSPCCSDGTCNGGETCGSCPDDCGACDPCSPCTGGCTTCGICGNPAADCAGTCGGGATVDCAGNCGGGCPWCDCAGTCQGGATVDCAGNCAGGCPWCDCAGACQGGATVDCTGTCGGGCPWCDCAGICQGTTTTDCTGTCGGTITSCCPPGDPCDGLCCMEGVPTCEPMLIECPPAW